MRVASCARPKRASVGELHALPRVRGLCPRAHLRLHCSHCLVSAFCCLRRYKLAIRIRDGLGQVFFARRVLHGTSIPRWREDGEWIYGARLSPPVSAETPLAFA